MALTLGSRSFDKISDLEKLVIHAATEYELNGYAEDFDGLEITDPEYDELVRKLRKLDPSSSAFDGTSPSTVHAKGSVVKHDPPMTSISKADGTVKEKCHILDHWMSDCAERIANASGAKVKPTELAVSYKRDGVAARFNYVDGKLVSAGQRPRDGVNGNDITRHVKYLKGVPQNLPLPLTLSLNGEIECWLKDFEKVNAEKDAAGEDLYKNPRNFAAGCMGRDNPEENKNSRLRVTFHSITGFDEWDEYYHTEVERAKWANSEDGLNLQDENGKGFYVQTREYTTGLRLMDMEMSSQSLDYYTDGIILKVNDLEDQYNLGHVGDDPIKEPRGAIAWKYKEETAIATVSSVEWNASRTGRIVPTAIFDIPFILADTENTRATCNNYGWMEAQSLGPGAVVECKKGGKIIPNIMRVVTPASSIGSPSNCPSCDTKLELNISDSGNKDLLCLNKDCPSKHVKNWIFYLQSIGGKGLGMSAMEKILSTGKVKNLADLYKLSIDDLLPHGFTNRQALLALATIHMVKPAKDDDRFLASIEKAKTVKNKIPAWQFFGALGIPNAGKTAGKALIAHFGNFEDICTATQEELVTIDKIGETTADAICDWFAKGGKQVVEELMNYVELELPKTGKLSGSNFVFTGAFSEGKKFWHKRVEDLGGNIQSSVGKTTSYLVAGDKVGKAKTDKAAKYGVDVINIEELKKLL